MTLDIIYKDYGDYIVYPINKTSYFKIVTSYRDRYEYYLSINNKTFFADNVNIYPMNIYDTKNYSNYFASIQFGDALKDKIIFDKINDQNLDIRISEYKGLFNKEITCIKKDKLLYKIYESQLTRSEAKLTLTYDSFDNNELELFIAFLSFVVYYEDGRS
jgi:hypothetical protein